MKVCPVCKARCFDDMEVCYGCLHRFAKKPGAEAAHEARQEVVRKEDREEQLRTDSKPERFPVVFGRAGEELLDGREVSRERAEESCSFEQDFLVLRIEMPRNVRGISITYE